MTFYVILKGSMDQQCCHGDKLFYIPIKEAIVIFPSDTKEVQMLAGSVQAGQLVC